MDWTSSNLPLPQHVETALCEIFGQCAREVRIVPHSLYARVHGRARATTRRNVIYLRAGIEEFVADPQLMLHEYFHVLQQWRPRRLSLARYLFESLLHGYWNNRFEREARDFSAAQIVRLQSLLKDACASTWTGQ